MIGLELSLPTPAENLACDEALLESAEQVGQGEILRFWESRIYFIVVGYGNSVEREVNQAFCRQAGLRVLRRCTGGGTVLQGPGCLNYALVLSTKRPETQRGIAATNEFVLGRHRAALSALLGLEVQRQGQTDLTLDGLKFSGNAQRRKQNFLLFHGSFLLNFDLGLIEQALRMPSRSPDYRANRTHLAFLTNLGISPHALKSALGQAWQIETNRADSDAIGSPPEVVSDSRKALGERIERLVREKYALDDWNFKF